jgi:limonene-1,2-epoxide hydrolase
MHPAEETVRAFLAAVDANDLEGILACFAEDAVYHNIPVQPVTGTAAIRAVLQSFLSLASQVQWVTHHLAVTPDGVVLTERTDRFLVRGKWIELPVMGAFEVQGGRITAWRDYFDMKQFQDQMAAA